MDGKHSMSFYSEISVFKFLRRTVDGKNYLACSTLSVSGDNRKKRAKAANPARRASAFSIVPLTKSLEQACEYLGYISLHLQKILITSISYNKVRRTPKNHSFCQPNIQQGPFLKGLGHAVSGNFVYFC